MLTALTKLTALSALGIGEATSAPPVEFSPADISGLQLWLKVDTLEAGGYVDEDVVDVWPDDSGNGNNATQPTFGARPTFYESIINGKPAVRFDGLGKFFSTPLTGPGANFTIFIVSASASENSGQSQIRFQALSTTNFVVFPWTSGGAGSPLAIDVNNGGVSGLATGFGTSFSVEAYRSAASATNGRQTWSNGVILAQQDTGSGALNVPLYIGAYGGASEFFSGDITEIIIYNAALTDEQRQQVEQYLGTKYGITISI